MIHVTCIYDSRYIAFALDSVHALRCVNSVVIYLDLMHGFQKRWIIYCSSDSYFKVYLRASDASGFAVTSGNVLLQFCKTEFLEKFKFQYNFVQCFNGSVLTYLTSPDISTLWSLHSIVWNLSIDLVLLGRFCVAIVKLTHWL